MNYTKILPDPHKLDAIKVGVICTTMKRGSEADKQSVAKALASMEVQKVKSLLYIAEKENSIGLSKSAKRALEGQIALIRSRTNKTTSQQQRSFSGKSSKGINPQISPSTTSTVSDSPKAEVEAKPRTTLERSISKNTSSTLRPEFFRYLPPGPGPYKKKPSIKNSTIIELNQSFESKSDLMLFLKTRFIPENTDFIQSLFPNWRLYFTDYKNAPKHVLFKHHDYEKTITIQWIINTFKDIPYTIQTKTMIHDFLVLLFKEDAKQEKEKYEEKEKQAEKERLAKKEAKENEGEAKQERENKTEEALNTFLKDLENLRQLLPLKLIENPSKIPNNLKIFEDLPNITLTKFAHKLGWYPIYKKKPKLRLPILEDKGSLSITQKKQFIQLLHNQPFNNWEQCVSENIKDSVTDINFLKSCIPLTTHNYRHQVYGYTGQTVSFRVGEKKHTLPLRSVAQANGFFKNVNQNLEIIPSFIYWVHGENALPHLDGYDPEHLKLYWPLGSI